MPVSGATRWLDPVNIFYIQQRWSWVCRFLFHRLPKFTKNINVDTRRFCFPSPMQEIISLKATSIIVENIAKIFYKHFEWSFEDMVDTFKYRKSNLTCIFAHLNTEKQIPLEILFILLWSWAPFFVEMILFTAPLCRSDMFIDFVSDNSSKELSFLKFWCWFQPAVSLQMIHRLRHILFICIFLLSFSLFFFSFLTFDCFFESLAIIVSVSDFLGMENSVISISRPAPRTTRIPIPPYFMLSVLWREFDHTFSSPGLLFADLSHRYFPPNATRVLNSFHP